MFKLPALAYAYDALSPTISSETLRLHHDKHHAKYVETTNALCEAEGLRPETLEDLVVQAYGSNRMKLFDNAAQAWNHAFFWSCMSPSKMRPSGVLAQAIDQAFGSLDGLKARFLEEGEGHFGSGWVWLLHTREGLTVASTHDAGNALVENGEVPLIACDVWEHAYYLDYHQDRKAYLQAWFDALPDWDFAGRQLQAAMGEGEAWRYPTPDASEPIRRQA